MTREDGLVEQHQPPHLRDGWIPLWLRWSPTSMFRLTLSEAQLFRHLNCNIQTNFFQVLDNQFLNTITVKSKTPDEHYQERVPILMVHGMGAGVGMWCKNLESLSSKRTVYAFDMLGFGRSSRPNFSDDPVDTEDVLVSSIEQLRRHLDLNKFVLLGHSFGGYLSFAYSLRYPQYVKHLVLIDPWGFSVREIDDNERPLWVSTLFKFVNFMNPLSFVRAVGPFGPRIVKVLRRDLKFVFSIDNEENETVLDYIYHCNAQTPSGEIAFRNLNDDFGWAKMPILDRASQLCPQLPITFIHGRRSWIDQSIGISVRNELPESRIDIHVVEGAGHHVYAEKAAIVNLLIKNICEDADSSYCNR